MMVTEKISQLLRTVFTAKEIFHIDIRPEWGNETANYRIEIRKGILDYLKHNYPDEVADSVWDLDSPPILKSFFVSISHCKGMGGFILSSRALGFDVENTARITQQVIDRVSMKEELKTCPQFELLWPAKEAVFKCSTEFYTISHIQVLDWKASQNDTYSFSSLTANGWAFKDSDHSYAVAIKKT